MNWKSFHLKFEFLEIKLEIKDQHGKFSKFSKI